MRDLPDALAVRKRVGAAIERWRKRHSGPGVKEFSREKLGAAVGRSMKTVERWENGVTAPGADDIARLAAFFRCEIGELFV